MIAYSVYFTVLVWHTITSLEGTRVDAMALRVAATHSPDTQMATEKVEDHES